MWPIKKVRKIELADAAKTLTENEAFKEACDRLEKNLVKGWTSTKPNGVEDRERIYTMFQLLTELKGQLAFMVADAILERKEHKDK